MRLEKLGYVNIRSFITLEEAHLEPCQTPKMSALTLHLRHLVVF